MEVMEERLRQMRRHRLELQRMRDRLAVLIDEAEAYERGGFIRENFERAKGALYGAQFAIATEAGALEDKQAAWHALDCDRAEERIRKERGFYIANKRRNT
jgi:hypothetical protein